MTTPTKRSRSGTAKAPGKTANKKAKTASGRTTGGKAAGGRASQSQGRTQAHADGAHVHDVTVTIPVDRAADVAKKAVSMPVATAQRVLPAKGGLPLYAGLGALGIAGVLEWPVAVGIGIGYAVLRRGGPLNPATDGDRQGGRASAK
jgi:hypothetical protein